MSDWHYENLSIGISCGIEGETDYQSNRIKVVESETFGECLYIDDSLQTSAFDEYIYHEMIAHGPILLHQNPKKVLVIGGGDGGTVREVLKHKAIEHVDLVEINERVIQTSRKLLPFSKLDESIKDRRLRVFIGCGHAFLKNPKNSDYDVIIVDCGDPNRESMILYSPEFIDLCKERSTRDAIINFQSQYYLGNEAFVKHFKTVCSPRFWSTSYYHCPIPTYPLGGIGFMLNCKTVKINTALLPPAGLRYFSKETFNAAYVLPNSFIESRFKSLYDHAVTRIFDWRTFILGIDSSMVDLFKNDLHGEGNIQPIGFPPRLFIIGKEDGRPYYKLRLCTDVAKEFFAKTLWRSVECRNGKFLEIDGVEPCGVEFDSRNNRRITVIYSTDSIEKACKLEPTIGIYYPEHYFSKGFINVGSVGETTVDVMAPKSWSKIGADGVIEKHLATTYSTIRRRVFKDVVDQVDLLESHGVKHFSMSYTDISNYELAFKI